MNDDFENLVSYFILAIAEEKVGNREYAKRLWEKIRGVGDIVETIAETEITGFFYTGGDE